jgi:ubiquinone/menaquinone biosynthesis C-methylase UbiE
MSNVVNPKEEWFWDEKIVGSYESWYEGKGKRADQLEKKLLSLLLGDFDRPVSLIEIGCGTTHFTRYFEKLGLQCTGYDLSPIMLGVARKLWPGDLIRGDSAILPFPDKSFDVVAFITCLEFMPRPVEVLREAVRIARQGILMGLMNRYGVSTIRRTVQVWLGKNPFYRHAHFYSLGEIRSILRKVAPLETHIDWKVTLLPRFFGDRINTKIPFGDFLGMSTKIGKPGRGE